MPYEDLEKKVQTLRPLYAELNRATYNITLRVNPDEADAQAVLRAMTSIQQLFQHEATTNSQAVLPFETQMLTASKRLLKSEWRRVVSGEQTFVLAKWAAMIVVVAALALGTAAAVRAHSDAGGRLQTHSTT